MDIKRIPGNAVRTWLRAARLPLTTVETVTGRSGGDWAPSLAVDRFQAGVKSVAGSILRDDSLVQEGKLTEAKVAQLRTAAELAAEAEAKRAEADAKFEERVESAEERRARVEREAAERLEAVEHERQEREREVARETARKRQAAKKVETATRKAVEREQRQADLVRLDAEAEALAAQEQAVAATGEVLDLDRELEVTKAVRKSR